MFTRGKSCYGFINHDPLNIDTKLITVVAIIWSVSIWVVNPDVNIYFRLRGSHRYGKEI